MRNLTQLSQEELDARASENQPEALYEKGMRAVDAGNSEEAKKYLFFAMQLGFMDACYPLGEIYATEGDGDNAVLAFREGKRSGDELSAYAFAANTLDSESDSLEYITNFANDGDKTSIALLCEYYHHIGNKRQAEYWRKKGKHIG